MSTLDEYAEVAYATYPHKKKNPTSSIREVTALLDRLDEKGNIKTDVKGGTVITEPQVLTENQTLINYIGAQRLNIGQSPTLNEVKMGWSQKAIAVVVTGREIMPCAL